MCHFLSLFVCCVFFEFKVRCGKIDKVLYKALRQLGAFLFVKGKSRRGAGWLGKLDGLGRTEVARAWVGTAWLWLGRSSGAFGSAVARALE